MDGHDQSLRLAAVRPAPAEPSACLWADEPALRGVIQALRKPGHSSVRLPLVSPPEEADLALTSLVVQRANGPVNVGVWGEELIIAGASEVLAQLANTLALYADYNDLDEPGMHTHVDRDWTPPPAWLAPTTTPLVVAGWVPEIG